MEQCTAEEVQRMIPLVSTQRREQALRYKHVLGQFSCLKSWMMLREMSGLVGEWSYNEHGKPYIPDGPYFSISHCKEGIAVAIDDEPVGIDIESIRRADEDLIIRTMYAREQEEIRSAQDPARAFTRLWTQKEALVKAQGIGIVSFEQLRDVRIQNSEFRIQTVENEKYIYSIAHK